MKDKIILVINTDGGSDRNYRFERVMASYLYLAVKYNLEKIIALKTATGGSFCNMVEQYMSTINIALSTATLNRILTNINL